MEATGRTYLTVCDFLKKLLFAESEAVTTKTIRETMRHPFKNPRKPPPILFRNPNPEILKNLPTNHPMMCAARIQARKIAMKLIALAVPGWKLVKNPEHC